MPTALASAIRNGTTAVSFPIKSVTIQLDEIGYEGWEMVLRVNVRNSVYDDLISGEEPRWWSALGQIVVSWNFVHEDNTPMLLPRECADQKVLDLPIGLLGFISNRWFDAVRTAAELSPKVSDNSAPISSTSEGQPRNE